MTKLATRGGRADLDHLKVQVPLHDTADELCAVAKDLRLASSDILLGAKATETTLKGMDLAQYRVLHFVTHGHCRRRDRRHQRARPDPHPTGAAD